MVSARKSVAALLAVVCLATAVPQAEAIEAAFVPAVDGGGDYLVRVEPDLVRGGSPYTFTSDVPADSRDVRRVKIYVADAWPPAVERSVIEASRRPRAAPVVASTGARIGDIDPALATKSDKPWALLTGSLIALFLSLGANGYLGMLLAQMRARYLRDLQAGVVKA
ncbi:MAG: hypothetical protein RLZZ111_86 [Planctomycetota bacterium]|jgi:hypothetical protein